MTLSEVIFSILGFLGCLALMGFVVMLIVAIIVYFLGGEL